MRRLDGNRAYRATRLPAKAWHTLPALFCTAALTLLQGCALGSPPITPSSRLQHILFVGDSFTHGRYTPVRPYNSSSTPGSGAASPLVTDENFGQTGARAELEPGPWGGISGIFAEFAAELHLKYDVHIEAISETSLEANYRAASGVIDQSKWDAVVLQELSARPIPESLSGSSTSDPRNFCDTVQTIEAGVHAASPSAKVYLYETWARADLAQTLSGPVLSSNFSALYLKNLAVLSAAYHNVYLSAAACNGHIAGVAPAGDAWALAWYQGIANPNPFTGSSAKPLLWYGLRSVNDPPISKPDYLHPSAAGAYLDGLVLFAKITGADVRTLGTAEKAAASLGVAPAVAVQLQAVAWETVANQVTEPVGQTVDPCTLTH